MIPRACRVVRCWHMHVYKLDTPTLASYMTKTKQIRYTVGVKKKFPLSRFKDFLKSVWKTFDKIFLCNF